MMLQMKTSLKISANYSHQLKTFIPMKLALLLMHGKLYIRPSRLKTQLSSFSISGTRFWNSLPKSVKDSPKFSLKKRYEILFSLCSNKKRAILNSKELHRSLQNIALHAEFSFDCA